MQVRELKAAKEKEQAAARGQIEALRLKLQREKNQELQVSDDTELVCASHVISDGCRPQWMVTLTCGCHNLQARATNFTEWSDWAQCHVLLNSMLMHMKLNWGRRLGVCPTTCGIKQRCKSVPPNSFTGW